MEIPFNFFFNEKYLKGTYLSSYWANISTFCKNEEKKFFKEKILFTICTTNYVQPVFYPLFNK